eukprot:3886851-Pleurochrysis_carterae.AAC.1
MIPLGRGWRGVGRGRCVQSVRLGRLRRVDNGLVRIRSQCSCHVRSRRRGGLSWYWMNDRGNGTRLTRAGKAQHTLADRSVKATATSGVG